MHSTATAGTRPNTKVVTGKVRLSYVNLFTPRRNDDGVEKFGCKLLIDKRDRATLQAIEAAVEAAKLLARESMGARAQHLRATLHDGDGDKPSGGPYGPECKGHMVLSVSSRQRPQIVDRHLEPITDPEELYSGCYGRVSLNLYPYDVSGNRGIAAGLNNVQKVADGQRLGNRMNAQDEFDEYDEYEDDEDSGLYN